MATGGRRSIAFAGVGPIAAVHSEAVAHVEGLEVSAIASRSPERTAEAAAALGVPGVTYAELPAGADAVLVATAPAHHAKAALAAMAAEVPVLVEKPLCTTLAEADLLVQVCEAGGRLAYAENLVHAPAVEVAFAHVADLSRVDVLDLRAIQPRPETGGYLTEAWGGGVLFDLGAHPLALALLFAAPARPIEVTATLEGGDDHPVDEHAVVALHFDTGARASLTVSWRAEDVAIWDAQVSAPDGVVRLELLPGLSVEHNGDDLALPPLPDGVPEQLEALGYRAQMAAFADDVTNGTTPMLGAAFGRSVLDVICAAYASAGRGGEPVALPFTGRRDRTPLELWKHP